MSVSSPSSRRAEAFRPDVEGLRAIAVVLVVLYHAGLARVTGGYVGVDVFFVLSGFLITGILVREVETTERIDFARFYGRRMLRLLPAATLVLLVTLVAERLLLGPLERIDLSLSGIATALYAGNVFFLTRATDYFAPGAETNPLLHTWSLAVEEQFYLVWPLLVLAGILLTRRLARRRMAFGVLLGLFSLVSFAGAVWLTRVRQPWAFFGTPARAWEFGIGGIVSLLPSLTTTSRARRVLDVVGVAGLLAVVASGFVFHPHTPFPGVAALLPTLGTAAVIVAGSSGRGIARLLGAAPLQWIGRRSYTWYLWHWPVLVLATAAQVAPTAMARGAWIALSLGLAVFTTRLVETPIRFAPQLRPFPRRALALGASLTAVAVVAAFAGWRDASATGGAFAAAAREQTQLAREDCIADLSAVTPRPCVHGDPHGQTTVVLLGDSHANQWFPAIDAIAKRAGWRLVTFAKYSCPVAEVPTYSRVLHRDYAECYAWRRATVASIASLHPRAVFVGQFARRAPRAPHPDGSRDSTTYAEWTAGMRATLGELRALGARPIVLRDSPFPRRDVPACLSHAAQRHLPATACGASRTVAVDDPTFAAERAAMAAVDGASFVDLTEEICDASTCPPMRDGVVVYHDANHLATAFVRHLAPAMERQLVPLVAKPVAPNAPVTAGGEAVPAKPPSG